MVGSTGANRNRIDIIAGERSLGDERHLTEMVTSTCRPGDESFVTVVVPRSQATVRNLHVPSRSAAEIESMVELQLARVIPHKKEDIVYGYTAAGKDSMGYTRVVVAVVLKDYLRQLMQAMEKTGQAPDTVVLSTGEIWRAVVSTGMAKTPKDALFAVIDVGALSSECFIATQQHILYSSVIPFGSDALAQGASSDAFLNEWQQTLSLFRAEESSESITRLYLTGIECEGLTDLLRKDGSFDVLEVQHALFRGVADDKRHLLERYSYSALVGSCRRSGLLPLTFRIPDLEAKAAIVSRARQLMVFGLLLLYAVGFFSLGLLNTVRIKDVQLKAVIAKNAEVDRLTGSVMRESPKILVAGEVLSRRRFQVYALRELLSSVDPTAKISYVSFGEGGSCVLRGTLPDSSGVFDLVAKIEAHPAFERAEIKYARRNKTAAGTTTMFEIACVAQQGGL